ncbi:serine hydroxymethyltransferase [Candidatus Bipolaricaulota bacterium]|nr:serine hydroxymethyltransferase [Candidatus Bipolaricaulota bacterium]
MSDSSHLPSISEIDPQISKLILAEERRQREKIILIPSESFTPPAVREALGSVFTSIYAEGYPRPAMRKCSPSQLSKLDQQLASYRRYADWRFYKGTEFADLVESLAGRRAAECFATTDYPAERIYANVQPLSGAAANLALYEAFVEPGDTVMGMDLTEGGHLTHGSQFNITGKRYHIVSYAVDRRTGKLDYDQMMRLAIKHRPRMLIGGFTSYPWQPDWVKFRQIADEVGAIFLADIAHTAGMVIGGVYPNPIGTAHVVMFTTHKTMCGPRGAVILSTDPKIAEKVDNAIFPGEQGGPHVNKFAAIAVTLKIAQSQEFKDLQHRIVENAAHLAKSLKKEGLTLAYGGTNTHLLLIDLKTLKSKTGFTMMGEIASRILDLVGIVCNKNTIPGDHSAADAHGIRLGTPWATQRGMGKEEMEIIASTISKVLRSIRPFSYLGLSGDLSRGKLPLSVLEEARADVGELLVRVDPAVKASSNAASAQPGSDPWTILRMQGGRATALLNEATPSDILTLKEGKHERCLLFDEEGKLISEVVIGRIKKEGYLLLVPKETGSRVKSWLSGLADGYILFDLKDIFRKVQGPALVREISADKIPVKAREWLLIDPPKARGETSIEEIYREKPDQFATHKSYFIGQNLLDLSGADPTRIEFLWEEKEAPLKRTPLYDEHRKLGAKLVSFAGWEMPVWYRSVLEEHRAVREKAGLFDLGHMGVFEVCGEYATEFINIAASNYAAWLEDGESQYAYLLAPDGNVIDDIFIYRRANDRYLVVVNAVNEDKDWEWLTGLNEGRYLIDQEIPSRRPGPKVTLRNLKAEQGVIDLALQGPLSQRILASVVGKREMLLISSLARTKFCEVKAKNYQMLIARTGYTGEEIGYEIYLDGAAASWLWSKLLEVGTPLGLLPCGLAARDSTRTEAGLPLHGNELAGPHNINPFEAGFAPYVKLHKPFFIGRSHCVAAYTNMTREVVRFEVNAGGTRPIHAGAAVVDRNGAYLGRVTSCISLGESQVGLALLDKLGVIPGTPITILNPPRQDEAGKPSADLSKGDHVAVPIPGTIIPRFP